jgi:predicted phosphodiesterase
MRIAALYDIHGNLPALEAVLAETERERPDLIVVGGDVASGPLPRPTIERLMALGPRAHFVRGNADRNLVAALDGRRPDPARPPEYRERLAWWAGQLGRAHRDFLAGFTAPTVFPVDGLGDAVFCHGSPRDEDEIITALTTDERLARIVAAVTAPLVVCGHTHMQFDRRLGGTRVVNAGSVGMPYGDPGAFWALLGPTVSLRRTAYDFDDAAERIRAGGFPWADDFVERNMRHPASAAEVATLFEGWAAEREQRAGQVEENQ